MSTTEDDGGTRRRGPGVLFSLVLLAPVGVVMGCRVADTDAVTPVPQLLAFLPWLVAPTALGAWCALRARWWTGVVAAVALLGLVAWYMEPYGRITRPGGAAVAELRVLTANVEFGRAAASLAGAVREKRADIVFVQECDAACTDLLKRELGEELPHLHDVPGSGSAGSVILSAHPLRAAAPVPGTMGMPGAVADVQGHNVRLQLAHPMPPLPQHLDAWRRELRALRDFAAAQGDQPTVLAGDFNASQDHAAFREILDTGLRDAARLDGSHRTPTWPSPTAAVFGAQIDHVLLSRHFSVEDADFLSLRNTDHRALVTRVALHPRP
jgi:endonuclease/exonuclease/phosphatase (EEP) superfamily protein YafD